jgi:hypothetical protein
MGFKALQLAGCAPFGRQQSGTGMFDGDKSDLRPLERRDDRGPVSQISADGAVEAMTSR